MKVLLPIIDANSDVLNKCATQKDLIDKLALLLKDNGITLNTTDTLPYFDSITFNDTKNMMLTMLKFD